jgi:hypothetical protein
MSRRRRKLITLGTPAAAGGSALTQRTVTDDARVLLPDDVSRVFAAGATSQLRSFRMLVALELMPPQHRSPKQTAKLPDRDDRRDDAELPALDPDIAYNARCKLSGPRMTTQSRLPRNRRMRWASAPRESWHAPYAPRLVPHRRSRVTRPFRRHSGCSLAASCSRARPASRPARR